MRKVVRSLSWVLVFATVGAVAASWFTPQPGLDADDAADVAVDALDSVGVDGRVTDEPELGTHQPSDGDRIDAWIVPVRVRGEEIEVRVRENVGRLVYVDDRIGPDRTERLLTDEQFDGLAEHRSEPARDGWIRRNGFGTVAGVLVAVTAFAIARRSDPLWPTEPPAEGPTTEVLP